MKEEPTFATWLEEQYACQPAIHWVGSRSLRAAWRDCDRADWLIWMALNAGVNHKACVYVTSECVRLSVMHKADHEELAMLESVQCWCQGESTTDNLRSIYSKVSWFEKDEIISPAVQSVVVAALKSGRVDYAALHAQAAILDAVTLAGGQDARSDLLRELADWVREYIPLKWVETAMEKKQ